MNRSPRLLTCLGAGLITLLAAPSARAATDAAPSPAPARTCGAAAADFAGGYQDIEYPEVGYLIDSTKNTITVYYRGTPIDQGPVKTGAGAIAWTLDGSTYFSVNLTCGNPSSPTRVTAIETIAPANQERVILSRA